MCHNSSKVSCNGTKRRVSLFAFTALFFVAAFDAAAAGLVPCRGMDCTLQHFFQMLVSVYNFLIGLAAVVATLFVVWGGIQYILAYFSENPQQQLQSAKFTITRAITGLIIIAAAYVIVHTLLVWLGLGGSGWFFGGVFLD